MPNQKEIMYYIGEASNLHRQIKYENKAAEESPYSCGCTSMKKMERDEVSLNFEDFYELMSQKII